MNPKTLDAKHKLHSALFDLLKNDGFVHALIPVTVALHLSHSTRQLGLAFIFLWVVLQLLSSIQRQIQASAPKRTWMSWCVVLALLMLQARSIILRDNYRGPVIFLLIGCGLLIASQLSRDRWLALLAWMGLAIAPIALFFAVQLSAIGDWSLGNIFSIYYQYVQPSMGSINRLATLLTFLTLAAWYYSTQTTSTWWRTVYLLIATGGYWLILGTDSRMAVVAVPWAIGLPWLAIRLRHRLTRRQRILSLLGVGGLSGAVAWQLVIEKGFASSDTMRLRMASCWIRKGMLQSGERIFMGSGYDTSGLREACEFVRPGQSFGHAHNTLAQIAGNHGALGLIVLIGITTLIVRGLWHQHNQQFAGSAPLAWSPWCSTSWLEVSLGLNLGLVVCTLSTTVHEFSPVNQLLIGLIAGSACINPTAMQQELNESSRQQP